MSDPVPRVAAGAAVFDRFRILRPLSAETKPRSWLAEDLSGNGTVVVKIASDPPVDLRQLGRLRSPFLVVPMHTAEIGSAPCWIRPYAAGRSLSEVLAEGPLGLPAALGAARGIAEALAALHAEGFLHERLHPWNLILDEEGSSTACRVVDFATAAATGPPAPAMRPSLRRMDYLAPERLGLTRAAIGSSADLYALGIILYEALTGRTPVRGATADERLRHIAHVEPDDPRRLGISMPRALAELVLRLTRRDPAERYRTARAAAFDLSLIAGELDAGDVVIGRTDVRDALAEPAFIGRRTELSAARQAIVQARRGEGGLVRLRAEAGSGRTRLLREIATLAMQGGAWTVETAPRPRAADFRYGIFTDLVSDVVAAAEQDEAVRDRLAARFARLPRALRASIPDLFLALERTEPHPVADEAPADWTPAATLLLDSIGTREKPLVLVVDDLELADPQSIAVLRRWAGDDPARGRHACVVCCLPPEEMDGDSIAAKLPPLVSVPVAPLTDSETSLLIESMTGPVPSAAQGLVLRLAAGLPSEACALLRGLLESGALVPGETGWRVLPAGLARAQTSGQAADLIARRFDSLDPTTLRYLSAGAVLGRSFLHPEAAEVAGLTPAEAQAALRVGCERRFLWNDAAAGLCHFAHERLRTLLSSERINDQERSALHVRAADWMVGNRPERTAEIAEHYERGGRSGTAFPFALRAAADAARVREFDRAERLYRIAWRNAESAERAVRLDLALGFSAALMWTGNLAQSARVLAEADPCAVEANERVRLLAQGAMLHSLRGDLGSARAQISRGLRLLRMPLPGGTLRPLLLVIAGRALPPALRRRRARSPEKSARVGQAVDFYLRLRDGAVAAAAPITELWAHLRSLSLLEVLGVSRKLAKHLAITPLVIGRLLPLRERRSRRYFDRAVALARTLGHDEDLAFLDLYRAGAAAQAGRFSESLEASDGAMQSFHGSGNTVAEAYAAQARAEALLGMGRLRESAAACRTASEAADRADLLDVAAPVQRVLAAATGGSTSLGPIRRLLEHPRACPAHRIELRIAEALVLLRLGRVEQAVASLRAARALRPQPFAPDRMNADTAAWLATALRAYAEGIPAAHAGVRNRALRDAAAAARRARWLARLHAVIAPHALRESALIAHLQGHARRSTGWLDRSIRGARSLGMEYELGKSLLLRSRIGPKGEAAARDGDESAAVELLRRCGAEFALAHPRDASRGGAAPWTPDRLSALLEYTHRIASAVTREQIVVAAEQAAASLLNAEVRKVFLLSEDAPHDRGATREQAELSAARTFAAAAAAAGRALVFRSDRPDGPENDLLGAGFEAAMAAPIPAGDRPAGALFVANRRLADPFDDADVAVAEALAAEAGVALANVGAVSELAGARAEMERRQSERAVLARENAELARSNLAALAYVRDAAHDLGAPARHVADFTKLIARRMRGILDPESETDMGIVVDQAEYMTLLLHDLVTLAEAGRNPSFSATSWDACLDQALRNLRAPLEEAGAAVTRDPLPALPADPIEVTRVFQNLIGNAVKYRGTEPPKVHVGCRREGGDWIVSVADNGIGISPEFHERVFVAFKRLHTREEYPGFGIGLAIVKKVAERHGGTVAVESEPGRGSTFILRFPAAEVSSRAEGTG